MNVPPEIHTIPRGALPFLCIVSATARIELAQRTIAQRTIKQGTITQGTIARGTIARGAIARGAIARGAIARGAIARGTIARGAIARGTIESTTEKGDGNFNIILYELFIHRFKRESVADKSKGHESRRRPTTLPPGIVGNHSLRY